MNDAQSTCWTMIAAAADGHNEERQRFALRYADALRAYFAARWRNSSMSAHIEDATQVVFMECLKDGGVLSHATREKHGGFRAFLYGTARNIARRFETGAARDRNQQPLDAMPASPPADETTLSIAFDRAWARQIMKQAAERMTARATETGPDALARVDLLRMRFEEGLPIRDIAKRWDRPAELLHREYARARKEFKEALLSVISFNHPDRPQQAREEYAHLLQVLG
ncbi:MAG: sigma-70 family RNA polymerase sigma factor [Phycisphaerae bacterium]